MRMRDADSEAARERIAPAQGRILAWNGCIAGLMKDGKVHCVPVRDCDEDALRKVRAWENIMQLSLGWSGHLLGLRADGTVVAAGNDWAGQCDVSGWRDIVNVTAGHGRSYGIRRDGTVVAIGNGEYGACATEKWTGIVQVADGPCHTAALREDGTVIAVGRGSYSPLVTEGWHDIVKIAAGNVFTMGLRADGRMVTTPYCQFNISSWDGIVDFSVSEHHVLGLRADGTVVAAPSHGSDTYDACRVGGWEDVIAIRACDTASVGIRHDGTVLRTMDSAPVWAGEEAYAHDHCAAWTGIAEVAPWGEGYRLIGLRADGTVVMDDQAWPGFYRLSE